MDEDWWSDLAFDYEETYEVWVDANGEEYAVEKMDLSHIENILRMIREKRFNSMWMQEYAETWTEVLTGELFRRKT